MEEELLHDSAILNFSPILLRLQHRRERCPGPTGARCPNPPAAVLNVIFVLVCLDKVEVGAVAAFWLLILVADACRFIACSKGQAVYVVAVTDQCLLY
jgi:hypothetical protein